MAIFISFSSAQQQQDIELERGDDDHWVVTWPSDPERTYFLIVSDDMTSWIYRPYIKLGTGVIMSHIYQTGPEIERLFFKVRYSDFPTSDPGNEDFDFDNITNYDEIVTWGTDPFIPDTDSDGMPDGWEVKHSLDPLVKTDPSGDLDDDGLTNLQESIAGSDPNVLDSDGDGLSGGDEVHSRGTDPTKADTDGDGESDSVEVQLGTDPMDAGSFLDTDGDGMPDNWEIENGLDQNDPADADKDDDYDRLTNLQEYQIGGVPSDGWTLVEIPQADMAEIFAINELGGAIGKTNNILQYWENGDTITIDDTLPFGPDARRTHINNQGLVVAGFHLIGGDDDMRIYRVAKGAATLIDSITKKSIFPSGITETGYVYGFFSETGGAPFEVFRWRNGVFENIGVPVSGQVHYVVGGNERGEVVVNSGGVGFLYSGGQWGALNGVAVALNDVGQVVLLQEDEPEYGGIEYYSVRNIDGSTRRLPDLDEPEIEEYERVGEVFINNQGHVVFSPKLPSNALAQEMDSILVDLSGTTYSLGESEPVPEDPVEEINFITRDMNRYGEVAGFMNDFYQRTTWGSDPNDSVSEENPGKKAVLWRDEQFVIDGINGASSDVLDG